IFPGLATAINQKVLNFLDFLSSRKSLDWIFPLLFFCGAVLIGVVIYHQAILVQDSAGQLFQAKIFARGRLFAPAPPVSEFFDYIGSFLVIHDGRWFGMYQPGLSLMLVPFLFLHAEWFLCPILGAASLAIWMQYMRRWYSPRL